ncbi:MAG: lysophospholipase [Nitrosomonas sp.]|nr:MAG: lysophospholipase [Nitrosomonas sp.]
MSLHGAIRHEAVSSGMVPRRFSVARMPYIFNRLLPVLIGVQLLLTTLSGCVYRQVVGEPYPRWGVELSTQSPGSGDALTVRTLQPEESGTAQACVLLVHGMNEHIGRYGEVARHFAERYAVAGFDLYAHGLSNPVLRRADLALARGEGRQDVGAAYLAQAALYDLEPLRKSLDQAIRQTIAFCGTQDGSKPPVFLVAHSLGTLVAASYLLQVQHEPDLVKRIGGVVFLAPAFSVSEPPGWRGWLADPVIKLSFHAKTHFLYPHDEPLPLLMINQLFALVTVPLLDGMFEVFSWPGIRAVLSPVSPAWVADYLTDSETEKAKLRADGWIVRRTLLRYVKGIETEVVRFRRRMGEFVLPYLLIASAHDPITPAWGGEDFASATLSHHPDNTVLMLPELLYHQHLFLAEPKRSELLRHIEQWIGRRLQSPDSLTNP